MTHKKRHHLLLLPALHFCIQPPSKSPPSANTSVCKDTLFSHRHKPGIITPPLLQINIAQLSWGSWILLLQADVMCQSCEPLFLTENNSSLFRTSLVKSLLKPPSPLARSQEGWKRHSFFSLARTSACACFHSATTPWAGQRLYFKNQSLTLLPTERIEACFDSRKAAQRGRQQTAWVRVAKFSS